MRTKKVTPVERLFALLVAVLICSLTAVAIRRDCTDPSTKSILSDDDPQQHDGVAEQLRSADSFPSDLQRNLLIILCGMTLWSLVEIHIGGAGDVIDAEEWLDAVLESSDFGDSTPTAASATTEPLDPRSRVILRAKRAAARGEEPVLLRAGPGLSTTDHRVPAEQQWYVRFCDRGCGAVPLRAHHCRSCGVCIPKLEHHCMWVGACVGHGNHKAFILFLFYALVGLLMACSIFVRRMGNIWWNVPTASVWDNCVRPTMLALIVTMFLIASLGYIFRFQVGVINSNTMSVERSNRRWKEQDGFSWPYDLGVFGNWKELLGRNVLLWPFPVLPDTNGHLWSDEDKYLTLRR